MRSFSCSPRSSCGPLALGIGLLALIFVLAVCGGFLLPVVRWFKMPDWIATVTVMAGVAAVAWLESDAWIPTLDLVHRSARARLPHRHQRRLILRVL